MCRDNTDQESNHNDHRDGLNSGQINLLNGLTDHDQRRASNAIQNRPGNLTQVFDMSRCRATQVFERASQHFRPLRFIRGGFIFTDSGSIDDVLQKLEMGCLETDQIGFDPQFGELLGAIIKYPRTGDINIIQTVTLKRNSLTSVGNHRCRGILQRQHIIKYPITPDPDNQPVILVFHIEI